MTGKSLMPIVSGEADAIHSKQDVIAYEIGGNAALIKGDYKIIYNRGAAGDEQWHLFNIAKDPGETEQLNTSKPEIYSDLLAEYERYVIANGVLEVPDDYEQREQVLSNAVQVRIVKPLQATLFNPVFIIGFTSVLTLLFFIVRKASGKST